MSIRIVVAVILFVITATITTTVTTTVTRSCGNRYRNGRITLIVVVVVTIF